MHYTTPANTLGAQETSVAGRSIKLAAKNWRTWLLFGVYACSFGAEVVVYNNIVQYFVQNYSMSQDSAGLAGALFGLMNIFARTMGGWLSDVASTHMGIRGRIWNLFLCALFMGVMLIVFSALTKDIHGIQGALVLIAVYSIFVHATNGAVYGLVPFIEPTAVGGVSGIVGAGGNVGALLGNFIMGIGQRPGFGVIGWFSLWAALLMPLLWIPGHGSMFRKANAGKPVRLSDRKRPGTGTVADTHKDKERDKDEDNAEAKRKADRNMEAKAPSDDEIVSACSYYSLEGPAEVYTCSSAQVNSTSLDLFQTSMHLFICTNPHLFIFSSQMYIAFRERPVHMPNTNVRISKSYKLHIVYM